MTCTIVYSLSALTDMHQCYNIHHAGEETSLKHDNDQCKIICMGCLKAQRFM